MFISRDEFIEFYRYLEYKLYPCYREDVRRAINNLFRYR